MGSYKSCPRLFELTYCDNWKPKGQSVHLHAGAAFAKGLEVARRAYHEGVYQAPIENEDKHLVWARDTPTEQEVGPFCKELAEAAGLRALLAAYGSFECPEDSAKSASRMAGALEFYYERYPLRQDDDFPVTFANGRRGIEFSFAHPLPILHPDTGDPILYCGRMDAINRYSGGNYIVDEKTTTQLGASWTRQWDLRAQFTGYDWGVLQSGVGIHIDGVIVRGVSILKTKYDTLEAVSFRPDWLIDQWYNELLEWVQEMVSAYQKNRFKHNYDHACAEYGGCTFRQVCSSSASYADSLLGTYFEQRVWNPLTREETLVNIPATTTASGEKAIISLDELMG